MAGNGRSAADALMHGVVRQRGHKNRWQARMAGLDREAEPLTIRDLSARHQRERHGSEDRKVQQQYGLRVK